MGQRSSGFTLIDVIVAAALAGAALLLVISLVPTGVLSLKKAEDLQSATAYGLEVIESSRGGLAQTAYLNEFTVTLNATSFHVERRSLTVAGSEGRLCDVMVSVSWDEPPTQIQLCTRLAQRTP